MTETECFSRHFQHCQIDIIKQKWSCVWTESLAIYGPGCWIEKASFIEKKKKINWIWASGKDGSTQPWSAGSCEASWKSGWSKHICWSCGWQASHNRRYAGHWTANIAAVKHSHKREKWTAKQKMFSWASADTKRQLKLIGAIMRGWSQSWLTSFNPRYVARLKYCCMAQWHLNM